MRKNQGRSVPGKLVIVEGVDGSGKSTQIRLLEKWLRGSGYVPTVASSGAEAIELVRATPFDAVLCDHRMAGMAGTEVFETIVAIRPELERRFVFMSGDVLNPELQGFVARRHVGLLAKPFDLATVRQTLEAVLRS